MDEFGVLVESIGFKAQGKSAPMAKLKSKPNFSSNNGFPQSIGINSTTSKNSSSFIVDDLDGIFRSNLNISNRKSHNYFDDDDIFGGPFSSTNQSGGIDLDSVFKSSSNSSNYKNSFGSNGHDDLMGLTPKERNSADDLFGNSGTKSSGLKGKKEENGPGFDDLIPGFGVTSPSNNGCLVHLNTANRISSYPDLLNLWIQLRYDLETEHVEGILFKFCPFDFSTCLVHCLHVKCCGN